MTSIDEIKLLPKCGIYGKLITDDTVTNKPCAIGSTAIVVMGSNTEVYILTPDNEWVKM